MAITFSNGTTVLPANKTAKSKLMAHNRKTVCVFIGLRLGLTGVFGTKHRRFCIGVGHFQSFISGGNLVKGVIEFG